MRRNIAENLNRLSRAHERYRRQTDDRRTGERSLKAHSFLSYGNGTHTDRRRAALLNAPTLMTGINSKKHTFRLLAFNPLSVVVVTSKVAADSLVDGAVVVQSTVQSVRIRTALRRNGCSIAAFTETTLRFH